LTFDDHARSRRRDGLPVNRYTQRGESNAGRSWSDASISSSSPIPACTWLHLHNIGTVLEISWVRRDFDRELGPWIQWHGFERSRQRWGRLSAVRIRELGHEFVACGLGGHLKMNAIVQQVDRQFVGIDSESGFIAKDSIDAISGCSLHFHLQRIGRRLVCPGHYADLDAVAQRNHRRRLSVANGQSESKQR